MDEITEVSETIIDLTNETKKNSEDGANNRLSESENFGYFARAASNYSWNIFRYIGDFLHLFGIFTCIFTLFRNRSCVGFSFRTQILYLITFLTRYLDLFDHSQKAYLVLFKIAYIVTSLGICATFWRWRTTWERSKDTCNLVAIFVVCIVPAFGATTKLSVLEVLWTFSEYLEAFAMVPQYVFSYRDVRNKDKGVSTFILCVGGYRVFYAFNWMYKKINLGGKYWDWNSWLGGIIEILFFVDYIAHHFGGTSWLKTIVLTLDENINKMSDKVELKVIGTASSYDAEHHTSVRKRNRMRHDSELDTLDV